MWLVFPVLTADLVAVAGHTGGVQRSAVPPKGGFAFTWGKGTLTLIDGTTHVCTVSGLGIQGHEGSIFGREVKGEVYNMSMLANFPGVYKRTLGDVSPERGTNTLIIKNERDVHIMITVQFERETGSLRILPSESGVTVKLEP